METLVRTSESGNQINEFSKESLGQFSYICVNLGARASATILDDILSIIEVYHGQRVQIGIFSTYSNKFWMKLSKKKFKS